MTVCFLVDLADFPDPDEFLGVDITNYTGWRDKIFQRLVQQARETMDQSRRLLLYNQTEDMMIKAVPIVPLYYTQGDVFIKPWVRLFPASPFKFWYFKDVIIDPH